MVYVLASLAGLVGASCGWLLTGIVIVLLSTIFGLPAADSASATFATLGPIGAIVGLACGVAVILRLKGGVRAPRDLAKRAGFTILFIAVLGVGAVHLGGAALAHLGINPQPPAVAFEIRLPAQAALTQLARSEAQVTLFTDQNETVAKLAGQWSTSDDGRPVLSGSVPLSYRTSQRTLALSLPGEPSRLFRLRLAPSPTPSDIFSPWHQVDFIDDGASLPQRARPDEGFAIRYKVL